MSGNSEPPGELAALTGIRGIAALWVVCHHFSEEWALLLPGINLFESVLKRGPWAVDFFFLLSGFILCYAQKLRGVVFGVREYLKFVWLRFARVYPNHAATLIALVLMLLVLRVRGITVDGNYPLSGLPFQFTMTHEFPWVTNGGKWNYPSWSISAEWFAYLFVFPFAWWIAKLRISGLVGFGAAMLIMLIWSLGTDLAKGFVPSGVWFRVTCGFLSGAFIYSVYERNSAGVFWATRFSTVTFLALIAMLVLIGNDVICRAMVLAIGFPVLLIGLTATNSVFSACMSSGPMVWMGQISYALYMSHGITEKVLKIALNPAGFENSSLSIRMGVLLLNLISVLVGALLLYYFIEIPFRGFLRRRKFGKPQLNPG